MGRRNPVARALRVWRPQVVRDRRRDRATGHVWDYEWWDEAVPQEDAEAHDAPDRQEGDDGD